MRKIKHTKRTILEFCFVLPALILYSIFVIYPLFGGIYYSLTDWNGISASWNFIGFKNYTEMLHDKYVMKPLVNSFIYAFFTTIILNVIGIAMALAVESLRHLSHFPICHECARDVIRTCRPYITHLHFGNAVADPMAAGYGDLHQRFGYPNSANDMPELLDYLTVLKEEGFFRAKDPLVLSMEVSPTKDEDEEIVLANTKRCLNRAWALLED